MTDNNTSPLASYTILSSWLRFPGTDMSCFLSLIHNWQPSVLNIPDSHNCFPKNTRFRLYISTHFLLWHLKQYNSTSLPASSASQSSWLHFLKMNKSYSLSTIHSQRPLSLASPHFHHHSKSNTRCSLYISIRPLP